MSGGPGATQISTVVTWLEMLAPPRRAPSQPPAAGLEVVRALAPTVSFYRYLYDTVGADWVWVDRRLLGADELRSIIQAPTTDIRVLWSSGVPAGFAEFDTAVPGEVELAYFGLIPDFVGRGIGRFFLDWAVDHAWRLGPSRVWVHTCDLDHPRALPNYEAAGFEAYDRTTETAQLPKGTKLPPHRSAQGVG
jgi:GNAT superfamily N-acetyltransferase